MKIIKNNISYVYALVLSVVLQVLGLNLFLFNTDLTTGGVQGLGISLMYGLNYIGGHTSFGVVYLALNVPLFLLAGFKISRKFTIYSLLNVVLVSIFSDLVPKYPLVHDLLINIIVGSALIARGVTTAISYGQSTGGSDILGMIFIKMKKGSIGTVNIITAVIAFALIFVAKDFTNLAYSFIAELIVAYLIDIGYHPNIKQAYLIISPKTEQIKKQIIVKMNRSCTIFKTTGAIEQKQQETLYCVVSKDQAKYLNTIIRGFDKNAFVTSGDIKRVTGEGDDRVGTRRYSLGQIKQLQKEIQTLHHDASEELMK